MGVLPDMAHDVGISIPAAGNMIALVCLRRGDRRADHGAALQPVFPEIGDAVPRLACVFSAIPCLPSPVATPCWRLAGWFPGFPHGAFFGVGAIILSKIAPPGKVTAAVAGMIGGMTIANWWASRAAPSLGITSAGAIPLRLSRYLTWRYFWRSSAGCPRFMTGPARGCASSSVFLPPRRRG